MLLPLACAGLVGCSDSSPTAGDGTIADTLLPAEARVDLKSDLSLAPIVDLRADVNRNGAVDLTDPTEDKDEDTWDDKHGAIFLANLDDDKNTCPKSGTDVALAMCNDGADEVVNGPDDLLDLAPLKTVPWPGAPADAVGTITVSDAAKNTVRLFRKQGSDLVVFAPEKDTLSAAELRAGVELALEGKDVVRDDSVWDGFVDLTFTVKAASIVTPVSDKVRLRVAPLILQHHLNPPSYLLATQIQGDPGSTAFLKDFTAAITAAGIAKPLVKLSIYDQWTQDLFEVATMSMPAVGGPHVITVFIRSANVENPKSKTSPLRAAGQVVFNLRTKDVAAIQQFDINHAMDMDSLNSFGNTETVPPYSLDGKSYPLGRIFRGKTASFYPDPKMTKLFESQKVQPPLYIDTSWLLVGHVDETITFVKASTPRGWALVVNDPVMAKTMLEQASKDGFGATKVFEGMSWYDNWGKPYSAETTVDGILADTGVMAESAKSATEIAGQLATIKKETGITDAEILHLPFLHWTVMGLAVAYQVGTVNGVSLGDAHYAMPEPHGPIINGKDPFKTQAEAEFAKVGITVHWVENWDLYHALDGEIHCGSNTARQPPNLNWWETGR